METDKLNVVAHRRYAPGGDQPGGTYVLGAGPGAPHNQKLVLLAEVKEMVHDLEHAKAKQDAVLADVMNLLGLPPKSDWSRISENLVELVNRPSLDFKGKSTLTNGNMELSFTLTPATMEAFKIQWPDDAPVAADPIDWKG